jgi:hypothetical protein
MRQSAWLHCGRLRLWDEFKMQTALLPFAVIVTRRTWLGSEAPAARPAGPLSGVDLSHRPCGQSEPDQIEREHDRLFGASQNACGRPPMDVAGVIYFSRSPLTATTRF